MNEYLKGKIKSSLNSWENDLRYLLNRKDILVIHFGIQKVFDGYEISLTGHTWFDNNDLWLSGEEWSPSIKYISLGHDSLNFERQLVLNTFEILIQDELIKCSIIHNSVIVTVGFVDGNYKRLQ